MGLLGQAVNLLDLVVDSDTMKLAEEINEDMRYVSQNAIFDS
jgi:hypothetical protein